MSDPNWARTGRPAGSSKRTESAVIVVSLSPFEKWISTVVCTFTPVAPSRGLTWTTLVPHIAISAAANVKDTLQRRISLSVVATVYLIREGVRCEALLFDGLR